MKERFVVCIENGECSDLETRKLYRVVPDIEAEREGYLRVVDESGENYLYPESSFVPVDVPQHAHASLRSAK
jgi:hypothetical protein